MGRTRDERRIGGKTSSALARVAPDSDQDRSCRSELKGRDRPSGEKVTDESSSSGPAASTGFARRDFRVLLMELAFPAQSFTSDR